MKYAKPIKFKRAIKILIEFLDAENGIRFSNRNDWEMEVFETKQSVDSKDWKKFDQMVRDLDLIGVAYGDAYDSINMEVELFLDKTSKMLSQIRWK